MFESGSSGIIYHRVPKIQGWRICYTLILLNNWK